MTETWATLLYNHTLNRHVFAIVFIVFVTVTNKYKTAKRATYVANDKQQISLGFVPGADVLVALQLIVHSRDVGIALQKHQNRTLLRILKPSISSNEVQ